ncbi:MAG TPA: dihydropyrimidine dehydrogenase, partial [bacterium]|nr:dihydropyrimidine dehydrogenase [bacterium]
QDDLQSVLTNVSLTRSDLIATDPETMETSLEGVYAGGDIVNGGATIVQAIAEGMRAATAIGQWLMSNKEI